MEISFRPHSMENIPHRIKWLDDEKISRYVVDDFVKKTNQEEKEEWFDSYEISGSKKFFTILAEGNPAGFVGLSRINNQTKEAELFIMIGEKDFQKKGIGEIAFRFIYDFAGNLGMKKIKLQVNKKIFPRKNYTLVQIPKIKNSFLAT